LLTLPDSPAHVQCTRSVGLADGFVYWSGLRRLDLSRTVGRVQGTQI